MPHMQIRVERNNAVLIRKLSKDPHYRWWSTTKIVNELIHRALMLKKISIK